MDMKLFKRDIDELISAFAKGNSTSLAEMKRIWLSMKFTYLFEASPSTNQGFFMQSLYGHSIGFLVSRDSLSHRLGGLYCLYCLFETQPFMPPFKIYLSIGEMKRLQDLVADAKAKDIKVVSSLVKSMIQRNIFLFGSVDINEGSAAERVNQLTDIQNARVQMAYKKLFANTRLEHFIHMDLGMELDVDELKKRSTDYAASKERAITEGSRLVDVKNIKHIAEEKEEEEEDRKLLIGDMIEKTAKEWDLEKEVFYQQTGTTCQQRLSEEDNEHPKRQKKLDKNGSGNVKDHPDDDDVDDDFGKELEDALLALPPYRDDNEDDTDDNS